jgi:excisionase family DNA binding protein
MTLLSPHDLARALGVSESSLKRWIDAGKIRASRTEGGHRRVSLADALAFIRETNTPVAHPELLGMPVGIAPPVRAPDVVLRSPGPGAIDDDAVIRALHEGDAGAVAARLHADHRAGASIAALCDGPIRRAMHAIGELWQHDPEGVVIEHRATDACLQALGSLRTAIDAPPDAPVALGGAPEDDPYLLPSAMAALVLAIAGFRTINLGADTPTHALYRAVDHHRPQLIWISASAPLVLAQAHDLAGFLTSLPPEITAIVGGRHAAAIVEADPRIRGAGSMTELLALAGDLHR